MLDEMTDSDVLLLCFHSQAACFLIDYCRVQCDTSHLTCARQQDFWLLVLNRIFIYNFKLEWPRSSYRIREGLVTLNTPLNHRKTWKDKLEDYEVIRPSLTLFWWGIYLKICQIIF